MNSVELMDGKVQLSTRRHLTCVNSVEEVEVLACHEALARLVWCKTHAILKTKCSIASVLFLRKLQRTCVKQKMMDVDYRFRSLP